MNERENRNATIVVIIILLAIVSVAVFFWRSSTSPLTTEMVSLPKVSTVLKSSDGKTHSIEAIFMLDLDKKSVSGIDRDTIKNVIHETIAKLDYDVITGVDGVNYLKSAVTEAISGFFEEGELEGVYLTDFLSDFALPEDSPPPSKRDEVFRGLFPNAK